ncbi:Response regulator receiver domain-containing protein [Niastella yeongjuensis]|nr:Response regulator receiver domain-containing protein [Niastella yeongjuensis]
MELFDLLSKHNFVNSDVIFLDINMPKIDGWECLKQLKNNPDYNSIPVIIYSTSSAKKDIETAYNLGAQLFLSKPEDFRELTKILEVVATSSQDSLLRNLKGYKCVKII